MEDIHGSVQFITRQGEYVSVGSVLEDHRVTLQHRRYGFQIVTQPGGFLKVEFGGSLLHLRLKGANDWRSLALHELAQVLRKFAMSVGTDAPGTRRRAFANIAQQTRPALRLVAFEDTR